MSKTELGRAGVLARVESKQLRLVDGARAKWRRENFIALGDLSS